MNIHIGEMVYTLKIPMLIKAMGYMGSSVMAAVVTSHSLNPYDWAWPDWVKWGIVITIQLFVLYRAIKNRNKR